MQDRLYNMDTISSQLASKICRRGQTEKWSHHRLPVALFIQLFHCALPTDFPKVSGNTAALLIIVNHLLFIIPKDVTQLVEFLIQRMFR